LKNSLFDNVATTVSEGAGKAWATIAAFALILIWTIGGFIIGFSDTYQLVINTGTTIVTFLMVFLIQHEQNKSSTAIQLKLDEIIRAIDNAHDSMIGIEGLDEKEVQNIKKDIEKYRTN
jgi:low affinity Fe/Cu permease